MTLADTAKVQFVQLQLCVRCFAHGHKDCCCCFHGDWKKKLSPPALISSSGAWVTLNSSTASLLLNHTHRFSPAHSLPSIPPLTSNCCLLALKNSLLKVFLMFQPCGNIYIYIFAWHQSRSIVVQSSLVLKLIKQQFDRSWHCCNVCWRLSAGLLQEVWSSEAHYWMETFLKKMPRLGCWTLVCVKQCKQTVVML